MGATVMAVGGDNELFVVLSCINIVVAANAGGAFSPFGDITTLMVWTSKKVQPTSESADELDVLISVTCRLPMLSQCYHPSFYFRHLMCRWPPQVQGWQFMKLLLPSLVNWLLPALYLSRRIPEASI